MPVLDSPSDTPSVPMRPSPLRWVAALLAVTLVAVLIGAFAHRLTPSVSHAPFDVTLRVTPPAARIELDGRPVGVGTWRASLPRDGVTHLLRVSAPDHTTQRLYFADAPPPSTVTLDPVSP